MAPRGLRFDIALAGVLTITTQMELVLASGVEGSRVAQHASFAVMTVALAWRRRSPVWAAAAVAGGMTAQTVLAGPAPVLGGLLAAIVVTYSAAAYTDGRGAVLGAAAIALGVVGSGLYDEANRTAGDFFGNLLIFGVIWSLGRVVRLGRGRSDRLEADLRDEQQRGEQAAAAERARIARELHDVIAHHVTAMTLQAGAARQVLDRQPDLVREPLEVVEDHGRQAMDEMRRLLGILREGSPSPTSEHLQPSLQGIGDFVEQARRTGLPVSLTVLGEARDLPPGVDLAAYRIVQEALTNALKHSGDATVSVCIDYGVDNLSIEVIDDGSGGTPRRSGGGHGLVGMRERASLYGGQVDAGPRPDGGFAVRARLPTEATTA